METCRKTSRPHRWKESTRKPGSYACEDCTSIFPCRASEYCGHSDCVELRDANVPKCWYCHHEIVDEPEPTVTVLVDGKVAQKFLNFALSGATKAAHSSCRVRAVAKGKAEEDRRARIALGEVGPQDV